MCKTFIKDFFPNNLCIITKVMKAELNFQGEKFCRERGRVMKDVQDRKKKKAGKMIIKFVLTFL